MEKVFFNQIFLVKQNEIRLTVFFNTLLIWMLFAIQLTPYIHRNIPNILKITILFIWFLSAALNEKGELPTEKDRIVVYSVIYWLIEFVWRIVGLSELNYLVYFVRLSVFAIPMISIYVLNYYSYSEKKILLSGLKVIFLANLISNFYLYLIDPMLFFNLGIVSAVGRATNAGGTSFIFVCVLFISITLIRILNTKLTLGTLLDAGLILFCMYHIVFQNNRATAFVILMVMIFSLLLVSTGRVKNNLKLRLFVRGGVGVLLFLSVSIPFLEVSSTFFSDAYMGPRLAILTSFLKGESSLALASGDSFSGRVALMHAGLSTVFNSFSNFQFGVGEPNCGLYNFRQLLKAGISNHSELIDSFTFYGVGGGVVYLLFFKSIANFVKGYCVSNQMCRHCSVALIIIFIYSILNKLFVGDIMYMLVLYFPLTINLMSMNERTFLLSKKID